MYFWTRKIKAVIAILIFILLLKEAGLACFSYVPKEEVQKGYALVEVSFKKKDVDGLIALLINSNYLVQQRAALYLGQLHAKKALSVLREKDRGYLRYSTVSLGAFSAAIALIENDNDEARCQALLMLAKTGFNSLNDLESWQQESIMEIRRIRSTIISTKVQQGLEAWQQWGLESKQYMQSSDAKTMVEIDRINKMVNEARRCIQEKRVWDYADQERQNAGAEALLDFANDEIIRQLEPIRSYGTQYTVLLYRCRQLTDAKAISLCITALDEHETPQKAEAAERILKLYGKLTLKQVTKLHKKHLAYITKSPPPYTIHHTIVRRCENIINAIKSEEKY